MVSPVPATEDFFCLSDTITDFSAFYRLLSNMNMSGPVVMLFRLRLIGALLVALVTLAGCVGAPVKQEAPAKKEAVFYPRPPDPPRIQHLATYASASDLESPESENALKTFLLGEEKAEIGLSRPYGVAMFDGKIYVADSRAPGLAIFDLKAKKFSIVAGAGSGRMQRPINVTIDTDGTKYVTDSGRNQILVFSRNDTYITAYGEKDGFKPIDTAIVGDRLYVVDIGHHEVQVLNKTTGKLLFKFGRAGGPTGGPDLHQPTNLAIGIEGDIYVVETGNFRVTRYTPEGKFVRHYGEPGQAPGQFARPKGIAIDRAGRMYVGDAAFQNVQMFDKEGRLLMAFGQPDNAPGLNLPAGVAIDYDNVALFRDRADPKFTLEHVILVVSQFGPNQVDVFGFGRMQGVEYPADGQLTFTPR